MLVATRYWGSALSTPPLYCRASTAAGVARAIAVNCAAYAACTISTTLHGVAGGAAGAAGIGVAIIAGLKESLGGAIAARVVALAGRAAAVAIVDLIAVITSLRTRHGVVAAKGYRGIGAGVGCCISKLGCICRGSIDEHCATIKVLCRALRFAPAIGCTVVAAGALTVRATGEAALGLWCSKTAGSEGEGRQKDQ